MGIDWMTGDELSPGHPARLHRVHRRPADGAPDRRRSRLDAKKGPPLRTGGRTTRSNDNKTSERTTDSDTPQTPEPPPLERQPRRPRHRQWLATPHHRPRPPCRSASRPTPASCPPAARLRFPCRPGPPGTTTSRLLGRSPLGWALICGICRTTRHATREANNQRHAFDALRDFATAAGWTLDAFWRWACPPCQQTPRYWPLPHRRPRRPQRPARPKLAGEHVTATAEFWLEVTAEQASFEQVRGARARTAAHHPARRPVHHRPDHQRQPRRPGLPRPPPGSRIMTGPEHYVEAEAAPRRR